MTTLHTLSHPRFLETCLSLIRPGDALLLIEDGVYLLGSHKLPDNIPLHALIDDARTRGLQARLESFVTPVDFPGFVTLVCQYDKLVNWI